MQASLMADVFQELRVCTLSDFGSTARKVAALGIPVDCLSVDPGVRSPSTTIALSRYLRRHRPDIVHVCTGALTMHGLAAATLAQVPVRIAEEVGIPRRGRVGRVVFPGLYRMASRVIGVSSAVTDYLVTNDGVPGWKASLIYNAVDDHFFEMHERPARRPGPLRLLTVGRLDAIKGQDVLVRAIEGPIRDGHVRLSIVGDGPARQQLVELCRELGVEGGVTFRGHQSDVRPELLAADVFVLPSRSEGFGLAAVEAMAMRLPVIATDVGGLPEILRGTVAEPFLVPPDDVLALSDAVNRMLLVSERHRTRMGRELRARAEDFRPQRWTEELTRLYADELAKASSVKSRG